MGRKCEDCGNTDWDEWYMSTCHVVQSCKEAAASEKELADLKLQNGEFWDHLMTAWGVIANAGPEGCLGNWKKMDPRWVEVAEKWRDKWHEMRKALRVPIEEVIAALPDTEKPIDASTKATDGFLALPPGQKTTFRLENRTEVVPTGYGEVCAGCGNLVRISCTCVQRPQGDA